MLVLPLGQRRSVGLYRSSTTGLVVVAWRGGHVEDVRRWLEMFKHADDLITAYAKR